MFQTLNTNQKDPISSQSILQLYKRLQPSRKTRIIDIGANPVDGQPEYWPLYKESLCKIWGFEPQSSALEKLQEGNLPDTVYLPYILGDGNPATLHVCRALGMTSLLKPSEFTTTKVFSAFKEYAVIDQIVPVETYRLDDLNIDNLDLIKIDVQGSELVILQNGLQKLKDVVMIQTEVSFVPLYEEQPSFGTMDQFFRSQGFVPHCFAQINRQPIRPCTSNKNVNSINQVMEADIVYIPSFERISQLPDEKLKHLALLAHASYGSTDLALHCLMILQERGTIK